MEDVRLVRAAKYGTMVPLRLEGFRRRVAAETPAATEAQYIPREIEEPEPCRVQKRGKGALLVKAACRSEIKDIDAVQRAIGRVPNKMVDRRRGVGVSRLPQDREEGLGIAHG